MARPRRRQGDRRCHHGAGGEHPGPVDVLHELGDVVVRRVVEDLLRLDLHDSAVPHHRDPVAESHGLVQVVRDEEDGLAELALQLDQLVLHLALDEGSRALNASSISMIFVPAANARARPTR